MEKRFDALSAAALMQADGTLTQIAAGERLTDEETARLTARVLQKAGLSGTPVIRKKTNLRRIGVVLLTAALVLTAMTASVSGYLVYNRAHAAKNFGELGTRRLEEMELTSPVTYTNGIVDVTVEAVLCDGQYALVLATMETTDPGMDVVWDRQCMPYELTMPYEEAVNSMVFGYEKALLEDVSVQEVGEQGWVTWTFSIEEGHAGETMTLCFYETTRAEPNGKDMPVNDATCGITMEIPLVQNTPVLTLVSDAGETLHLSGYQLYADRMGAFSPQPFRLHRRDGSIADAEIISVSESAMSSETETWGKTAARIYECLPDVRFDAFDPDTFIGFLDVSEVIAIEVDGVMYRVQE